MKLNKKIDDAQWYIVTVVSGNEDSVIKNLKGKIEAYGLSNLVQDIKVIKEKIITVEEFNEDNLPINYGRKIKDVKWESYKDANGKTKFKKIKTVEVNKFFGYIFIKMVMTDEVWFAIRNTQLITGIVGSSGKNAKPIPVSSDEIENILNASESKKPVQTLDDEVLVTNEDSIVIEKKKFVANFSIGQNVKVLNGPFKDSIGIVRSIDDSKGVCLISINVFGRDTDTEVSFSDVELDK